MVAVVLVLVIVIGILALLAFVVHRAKPKRFKLSAGLWKILILNVEVDSGSDVEKLPEGKHRALPGSEGKAR